MSARRTARCTAHRRAAAGAFSGPTPKLAKAASEIDWSHAEPQALRSAPLHALAPAIQAKPRPAGLRKSVVLASEDPELQPALTRAGFSVRRVSFTPHDAQAAAKIEHFETYNRTPASQRVADIARVLIETPHAILVADGVAAPAAVLALALAPIDRAVLDVGQFDTSSEQRLKSTPPP